jgi:hypothetical protein
MRPTCCKRGAGSESKVGNKKLRIIKTETDNLVSNLRGEIAEVVTTWLLMRRFMTSAASLQTDDVTKDFGNPDLAFLYVLKDKLEDELVARLSELAEGKIGCLNFYFAAEKLGRFHPKVADFSKYIEKNGFRQKRNQDISHKELPEKWEDHRAPLHIPYRTMLHAIASALRLMKRIDRHVLGPSAPYLWREVRKRRYKPIVSPPRVQFMLVPYYHLSGEDRLRIVGEEEREGIKVWTEMSTTINGLPTKLLVSQKWGVIMLGDRPVALDQYPLQKLNGIQASHPIYEQRTISAKYRCGYASQNKLSFEPVTRQHQFEDGRTTELVDISVNLNDKIRKSMGLVNVGDVKDFTLSIQILAGFKLPADSRPDAAAAPA